MNRIRLLMLASAVAACVSATAQYVSLLPIQKAAEVEYPEETVVDEDFALMAKGSETEPDSEMFVSVADANYPFVDDSLTHAPGWSGQNLFQAGGTVCLGSTDGVSGYLNIPMGDYSGEVTATFRVKNISNVNAYVCATFCKNGVMNPEMVSETAGKTMVTLRKSTDWQTVELKFDNTYGKTDCFMQINCMMGRVVVDDVKVVVRTTFLTAPVMHSARDFTFDGFTASWSSVAKAEEYLFTLYEQVAVSDADSSLVVEDFEGLSVTDGKIAPASIPEGWTISIADNKQVYEGEDDGLLGGKYSLRLSSSGDMLVTPNNGGMLKHFNIEVYKVKTGTGTPKISVEVYDGAKWVMLGSFYVAEGIPDIKPANLLLDYNIGKTPRFYQVRITCLDFNGTEVAFDNLDMVTTTPTRKQFVLTDSVVCDTAVVLKGLNPESDYYYYVRSRSNTLNMLSSVPDEVIFALGVATPEALPAENADARGGFTARWNGVPKATGYEVDLFSVYCAEKAVTGVVVLEDDFNGEYTTGTVANPYSIYNYSLNSLDGYADNIDWYGVWNLSAESALGCEDYDYTYSAGELQTPELSLGNGNGDFNVTLRVCGTDGDYLVVKNLAGYYNAVALSSEYTEVTIPMKEGQQNDILTFTAYNGHLFLIDKITVTQDLNAGDKVWRKMELAKADGNKTDSYRFSNLEEQDNTIFAYDVVAVYNKNGRKAYSKVSNKVEVDLFGNDTGINDVPSPGNAATTQPAVYDLSGRKLDAGKAVGKGIFIIKADGKTRKVSVR
ncbi:MAG: hypothetical protein ACI4BA_03445 [Prevotella sp.]